MSAPLERFARVLGRGAASPTFRNWDLAGPHDPLVRAGVLRFDGRLSAWPCPCGSCGFPRLERDGDGWSYWCEGEEGRVFLSDADVTMWKLDGPRFLALLADAFGCRGRRDLVPWRLVSLGVAADKLGGKRREIVVARRLGKADLDLLAKIPPGKCLLVVCGAGMVSPEGDLGLRTFSLADLVSAVTPRGFEIDLDVVDDRLGARYGSVGGRRRSDALRNHHKLFAAVANHYREIKDAHYRMGVERRDELMKRLTPAVVAREIGVVQQTVYSLLQVSMPLDKCRDIPLATLWRCCKEAELFGLSINKGTGVFTTVTMALRSADGYARAAS